MVESTFLFPASIGPMDHTLAQHPSLHCVVHIISSVQYVWSFRTPQNQRSLAPVMSDFDGRDIQRLMGPKFFRHLSSVEEKPRKNLRQRNWPERGSSLSALGEGQRCYPSITVFFSFLQTEYSWSFSLSFFHVAHGRLARWIKWRACDVGEGKGRLENELCRR